MNKLVYVVVGIIIIAIVGVVLVGTGTKSPQNLAPTTLVQTPSQNTSTIQNNTSTVSYPTTTVGNATTSPTQSNSTVLVYNSTPTGKNCASLSGYQCAAVRCTATNSSFSCTNATYGFSPSQNQSEMSLSIGQNTGTDWSGFGIAYVPQGTAITNGQPTATFYVADNSTSNVGTSLANGQSTFVQLDNDAMGGTPALRNGTIWVCYINSGILYVGNGCLTSSHLPAFYAQVATVNYT